MKNIVIILSLLVSTSLFAQEPIERGSLGIGGFYTCPQSDLKNIQYDGGLGLNINYLSPKFPYQAPINFQIGGRFDFSGMKGKNFGVLIDTPVPDSGDYSVSNSMAGFFLNGRVNFGNNQKLTPYADVLFGGRTFTTNASLLARNPELNPDFDSSAIYSRIVHTSRMHYGAGVGVVYAITNKIQLESSVVYTVGGKGAVQPLEDVTQDQNEIDFNYAADQRTDVLLINLGVRINLFKSERSYNPQPTTPNTGGNGGGSTGGSSTGGSGDSDKRYKDGGSNTGGSSPDSGGIKGGNTGGSSGGSTGSGKKGGIGVKGNSNKGGSDID